MTLSAGGFCLLVATVAAFSLQLWLGITWLVYRDVEHRARLAAYRRGRQATAPSGSLPVEGDRSESRVLRPDGHRVPAVDGTANGRGGGGPRGVDVPGTTDRGLRVEPVGAGLSEPLGLHA